MQWFIIGDMKSETKRTHCRCTSLTCTMTAHSIRGIS